MDEARGPQLDLALLERIAARDEAALGAFYDRHARLIFGLTRRILRNAADAEDVLQEVFVQVWTRAQSYNPALGAPVAWLVRIARNRAIDRLRSNGARGRTLDLPPSIAGGESPETGAARSEEQRAVMRALADLPAEQRTLIEHAYFEGRTQSELAERFGLPLGTVKTRVRSGLTALRRGLAGSPVPVASRWVP